MPPNPENAFSTAPTIDVDDLGLFLYDDNPAAHQTTPEAPADPAQPERVRAGETAVAAAVVVEPAKDKRPALDPDTFVALQEAPPELEARLQAKQAPKETDGQLPPPSPDQAVIFHQPRTAKAKPATPAKTHVPAHLLRASINRRMALGETPAADLFAAYNDSLKRGDPFPSGRPSLYPKQALQRQKARLMAQAAKDGNDAPVKAWLYEQHGKMQNFYKKRRDAGYPEFHPAAPSLKLSFGEKKRRDAQKKAEAREEKLAATRKAPAPGQIGATSPTPTLPAGEPTVPQTTEKGNHEQPARNVAAKPFQKVGVSLVDFLNPEGQPKKSRYVMVGAAAVLGALLVGAGANKLFRGRSKAKGKH